jgi:glutathione S-transferase
MTLTLYYHPFSSFCQKVLVAFYERDVPFEGIVVNPADPEQKAALERLWPIGKFPVLRDEARGVTVPESSLIVEYLDRAHPGPPPLVPAESEPALKARQWDRFFDHYVEFPLQKVVGDALRPEGGRDPYGVEEAGAMLERAYDLLEDSLTEEREWAAGDSFSLADCGAAPALFYANMVVPFAGRRNVEAYYDRLRARPSFARAVDEARPYRDFFPLPWLDGWD